MVEMQQLYIYIYIYIYIYKCEYIITGIPAREIILQNLRIDIIMPADFWMPFTGMPFFARLILNVNDSKHDVAFGSTARRTEWMIYTALYE